jgi:predicted DNA-binding transcriptional regulator AlpA
MNSLKMLTVRQACAVIGGADKPIHPSSYYRGVRRGIYPAPVHVGPNTVRDPEHELADAITRLIEAAR